MKALDFSWPGKVASFFATIQHFLHIFWSPLEYSFNQSFIVSFIWTTEILYPSGEPKSICMTFSEESKTYTLNVS